MAAELKHAFPDRVQEIRMIKGRGGIFEIRNGDELIFSKKQLGRFPEPGEIADILSSAGH
ncbi:SelT/SelW/SelH selenoprotein [Nitrolancea hollandica Lb]|uniref:SelT/SelW/SelH selenoprotein n=1 Tax=Nitrolancea hollandica Lb TaxID=1129897 RepID=I4EGG5_9BACT|nr:SelT/SelW/SelH selenoprotein [Nitrolancea hollandica Lb]